MIIISFISKSAAVNAGNVGNPQTLEFLPSAFDPFSYNVSKVTQHSFGGNAKKTTVKGKWKTATIETPYIEDANIKFWQEFYESVIGEEPFDVDATSLTGINSEYRVYVPDILLSTPRFSPCLGFTSQFTVRTIVPESE